MPMREGRAPFGPCGCREHDDEKRTRKTTAARARPRTRLLFMIDFPWRRVSSLQMTDYYCLEVVRRTCWPARQRASKRREVSSILPLTTSSLTHANTGVLDLKEAGVAKWGRNFDDRVLTDVKNPPFLQHECHRRGRSQRRQRHGHLSA